MQLNKCPMIKPYDIQTVPKEEQSRTGPLFCGLWDEKLLKFRNRRIFLDFNPAFFWAVVDSLNKKKYPSVSELEQLLVP